MKKPIALFSLLFALTACKSYYSIVTAPTAAPENYYGKACTSPVYVATIALSSDSRSFPEPTERVVYNQEIMTLTELLFYARKKYGKDVTIDNIRYDVRNGRTIVGVVYDVIRCNRLEEKEEN